MRWYVLQVKTGGELKVREALQRAGLPAKVPQELRPIRTGGSWTEKLYVLFPGYVFFGVEAFDADVYYTVTKLDGVVRLLGRTAGQREPQPITYPEAEYINLLAPDNEPLLPSVIQVDGDTTVVVEGVLTRIPGRLLKIEPRRKRAKALLTVLGEEKAVEFAVRVEGVAEDEAQEENEAAPPD